MTNRRTTAPTLLTLRRTRIFLSLPRKSHAIPASWNQHLLDSSAKAASRESVCHCGRNEALVAMTTE
jgi:hypothetical protein